MERARDTFRYDAAKVLELQEEFTLEPVAPATIRERAAGGDVLVTSDIPQTLGRSVAPTVDTGTSLYRLVQLFGTPNVVGLEAGAPQPPRNVTTWQYLFRAEHTPDGGDRDEFLLSIYDYRTDLSAGISEWAATADNGTGEPEVDRVAREPSGEPLPSGSPPDEAVLEDLVQLVLATVEHAVEATYEGLHV